MNGIRKAARAARVPIAVGAALLAATASSEAAGPPAPVGTAGSKVSLVARGIPSPTQIAFAHGRIFVGSAGDEEKNGKGGGIWQIANGKASRISSTPVFGVVYSHGALYTSGGNQVVAWTGWKGGAFTKKTVVFQRPAKDLPFLETMAVGADGRLYMGTGDAGDSGAIGAALSGRVLAITRDGSQVEQIAKGLRQPFGIAFLAGDPSPIVGNESDDRSNPPDFIVRAEKGSDFGFPRCQWMNPEAGACSGKTPPAVRLRPHASPTGLAGRGTTIYAAFFGGTTKQGPEIRAYTAQGRVSKQLVRSAVPVIGVGLQGPWLYFGDVSGSIYRVRI